VGKKKRFNFHLSYFISPWYNWKIALLALNKNHSLMSMLYTVIWQLPTLSYSDMPALYTVIFRCFQCAMVVYRRGRYCHTWVHTTDFLTAIENLSDPIGYLLDFTNPYYTALAGNMKARAEKDNSFWNRLESVFWKKNNG
jgi:hypothetical protein